jgi:UDP-glucose 4-epimerase
MIISNPITVLVTGSEGFIGRYIVKQLLQYGYQVIGLDNFSKYENNNVSIDSPLYKFVHGDVLDFKLLYSLVQESDYVIAGAALIGGISYFNAYPYDILAQNEKIIANTCDAAIKAWQSGLKLKRVVYLSSSMVYESTDTWPSVEGDQLKVPPPKSSYGFQKLAVEYFAKAAFDQYQLPYVICRPFNCVGVGEGKSKKSNQISSGEIKLTMSHVIPDLINKTLQGQKPLRVLGNGQQVRYYTYGADLAEGITRAMTSSQALNQDFNLSSEKGHTVLEVAELIWNKINPNQKFEYIGDKPLDYDVQKRIPDTNKAKHLLGFEAKTKLEDVIDEIISWVKHNMIN